MAAQSAIATGDRVACVVYAEPALLIEAAAQAQAYRALWLGGLTYPVDGAFPDDGTEQGDPGPSATPRPVTDVCGDAASEFGFDSLAPAPEGD